jgi:hypothetical protein
MKLNPNLNLEIEILVRPVKIKIGTKERNYKEWIPFMIKCVKSMMLKEKEKKNGNVLLLISNN